MIYDPVKRVMDIVLVFFLAVLFLPVWLFVPVLIILDSPGPVFYYHKRIGKNGKEFKLYKFRTMVKDADDILFNQDKELLARFKKNDWKLRYDPRITRLGRILRNLTIDEFPQLWNVFRGEMSIVGPRAYLKKELDEQGKKYPETRTYIEKIKRVKPGITGPWQTSGRNEIPFKKRVTMDADYIDRYSLLADLQILIKTPKAMISKW
jgi:lipopolysaccharide/colanic/teichoic acid biosynthesis glycosyltransferase